MSFCSRVKQELSKLPPARTCCAVAESYGVLLFCNTFSPNAIRIVTESRDFAQRLPKLFQKAFGLQFDQLPESTLLPYRQEGAGPLVLDREAVEALGVEVREYPLALAGRYVRHDTDALASAVMEVYRHRKLR